MNTLSTIGKYLDQPLRVARFSAAVPALLTAGALGYGIYDTYRAPEGKKKKRFIKDLCILSATVTSALIAIRGLPSIKVFGKQITKGFEGLTDIKSVKDVTKAQTEIVENFLKAQTGGISGFLKPKFLQKNNPVQGRVLDILNKAKTRVLGFSDLKFLHGELGKTKAGKKFLKELIPDPEDISSKKIFGEIGRLSLMGLMPVVGGMAGGVTGDFLTEKNWKKRIPNKIKEGSYQYLANIFLCNVGAGAALGIMEKMDVKSRAYKALGMAAGITVTGIIGGSAIANLIGKKCINPLFGENKQMSECERSKRLYSERTPEAIDVGLHVDDFATVGVLSGLKWVEPALPILYSISGFRAGIGYRNGKCDKEEKAGRHGNRNAAFRTDNTFKGYSGTSNRLFQRFTNKIS